MSDNSATDQTPRRTSLYALHERLGARFTPFAGYDMPVQYSDGVLKEHLHTRAAAGLFDVGHMGQIELRAKSGKVEDTALALERIVPVSVLGLKPERQRYAMLTNDAGGILDDLMIAHLGDRFMLVVNAATKDADLAHIDAAIGDSCEIAPRFDRALIALQGPRAEEALAALAPNVAQMRFMDVRQINIDGAEAIVSRSGYTGEDGFEIALEADQAQSLAEKLLAHDKVAPIGLGARDSLRLEAGLCLYGSDIDESTTPVEAALEWAIQKPRRSGGERAGGFPGAQIILDQLESGAARRRVGLKPEGRAPVRAGANLFADAESAEPIGTVTSGGFGPTLGAPMSMGYAPTEHAQPGETLFAEVRGKRLPLTVAATPFVPNTYKR